MSAEPKPVSSRHSDSSFLQDAQVPWELLEFAPVSLRIEDWSAVKRTLDSWRSAGIPDPVAHAAGDSARVEILARAFRIIDVNATSVAVYAAPDKASLIADFERHVVETISGDMRDFFLDAIEALDRGEKQIGVEAWDRRYDGQRIRVHISCAVAPNDRKWERVVLAIKDVTEAWQAREALDASRDLLAQGAALARLAHWIRDDATGAIIHCSEEIATITGRTPGEWITLVGSGMIEACIAPDDRAAYREAVPAAGAPAQPYTIEYRLWRPDGAERWVRESGAPLRQATAVGRRFLCTLQDITELRQAEARRKDAEAQLQGFLQNAPFAMFVKGLNRRYRYFNHYAAKTMGRPIEEIIGQRLEDLFSSETAEIYRNQDNRVLATRAPVIEETRAEGPTGEIWAEHIRFPILDEAGAVTGIGGIAIDVTERKRNEIALHKSEAQLRAFFENADVSMILKDAEGRCLLVSRGFERLYGLTNEEAQGKTVRELMPRGFAENVERLDRVVATTLLPQPDERTLERDGRTIYMVGIRFPIIGPDGSLTGIGQVSTDITELKRIEGELREQHEFLRLVIDSAAAYIMVFDGAGQLVACNRAYQTFCGASFEELRRDDGWTRYVLHEDLPEILRVLAPDDPGKFPNSDLTRSVRADGDIRLVHWVNAALTGPDGKIRNIICIGTDTTEQDRAEKALRESKARLKAFIDNAPFEMLLKDREGRYLMVNEHVAAVLGVPFDRLLGRRVTELGSAASVSSYADHDRAVLESGRPESRRTSWIAPDGTHWTQEIKFPIRNSAGEVTGIGGNGIDITAQLHTEQALRESEARWRAFKDNAPFQIFYKDPKGRYLDMNRQTERFWERRHGELIGRTTAEINRSGEDGRFIEHDQEVLRSKQPVTREFHTPGNPLGEWIRDVKFPIIDQTGAIVGIGGIGVDITDVKRAEQALQKSEANLRAVVEGIIEGIVIFDASGAIRSISQAAEHMLGYSAAELTGHGLGALFPQLASVADERTAGGFIGAIETWIGKSQELEAVARNDKHLTVAFSVNELPPSGGVRHFIGTILDLTTHKMLEDRLRQAQKMETIGQFTGGIAHDFNNLLAVIIGNLDLLAARVNEERACKLVERASGAAQRGADLTQRLLAFARRQRLEPSPVDLAALVQEIVPLVERTLGPEIQIRPVMPEGLWRALVDRVQLEAALLNLIGNARDAMPNGGELVIRTANYEIRPGSADAASRLPPGRYVEIAVVDSGTGMSPEVMQRAFEPFFTTKGVGRGTGLGLSMVHGFIQQSGGDVRIASAVGAGTTICLYLPATDRPQDRAEGSAPGGEKIGHAGQRILVVDDEPEVVDLVKELLGGLGYRVDTAGSGAEALERLKQPVAYDLLLTDVRMRGGMSGPQLVVQARAARPGLRVLYMSGYDDATMQQGGVPKGAVLLHKPFRNADLALAMVQALKA